MSMFSGIKEKKLLLICLLIIFLLNILLFLPSTGYDFVGDDNVLVVENPRIKKFSSLIKDLTSPFSLRADSPLLPYWRPLVLLSYHIDYRIWGLKPAGFHLTNIIFNAFNALLLFLLFYLLANNLFSAFLIAVFFSIHPAHVESAAWISGRTDILSTFFILAAILFIIRFVKKRKLFLYFLSLFALICALLCKEISLFLPFLIILVLLLNKKGSATPTAEGTGNPVPGRNYERVCFFNKLPQGISKKRLAAGSGEKSYRSGVILLSLPIAAITAAYIYIHSIFTHMPSFIFKTSIQDIFVIIKTIGAYTRILLFPFFPAPYFSMREFDQLTVSYILLFILAIFVIAWIIKRRDKFKLSLISLGSLIFLLPAINPKIIPAYPNISFRFAYISTLFAAVFYTEILQNIRGSATPANKPLRGSTQKGHRKKISYFSQLFRITNKKGAAPPAHKTLFVLFVFVLGVTFTAESLFFQGFFKSDQQKDIILNYYPEEEQFLFNIALRYARQGNYFQALQFMDAAIEKNKTNPWMSFLFQARLDKGRLLLYLDRLEEGRALFEQVIKNSPQSFHRFQGFLRLSEYYELKKDYANAYSMLIKAETMGPTPYLFYRQVHLLDLMGLRQKAVETIRKARAAGMMSPQLEQLEIKILN